MDARGGSYSRVKPPYDGQGARVVPCEFLHLGRVVLRQHLDGGHPLGQLVAAAAARAAVAVALAVVSALAAAAVVMVVMVVVAASVAVVMVVVVMVVMVVLPLVVVAVAAAAVAAAVAVGLALLLLLLLLVFGREPDEDGVNALSVAAAVTVGAVVAGTACGRDRGALRPQSGLLGHASLSLYSLLVLLLKAARIPLQPAVLDRGRVSENILHFRTVVFQSIPRAVKYTVRADRFFFRQLIVHSTLHTSKRMSEITPIRSDTN